MKVVAAEGKDSEQECALVRNFRIKKGTGFSFPSTMTFGFLFPRRNFENWNFVTNAAVMPDGACALPHEKDILPIPMIDLPKQERDQFTDQSIYYKMPCLHLAVLRENSEY